MGEFYIPDANGWQATSTNSSYLRIHGSTSYNIASNQTTVTVWLEAYNSGWGVQWGVLKDGTISRNGSTLYTFETPSVARTHYYTSNADTVFRQITSKSNPSSWSFVVNHNSDGSASFTAGVNLTLYHRRSNGQELLSAFYNRSGTVYLNEPRASSVSASNGTFGSAIPITISRYSSSFTHTVTTSCLGVSETLMSKGSSTSMDWTPSVSTYAPRLTSAMSTTATISCTTYSGSTAIGTSTASITVTLPAASVKPTATVSVEDAMGYAYTYGGYVATKSKYRITVTPTLMYGAAVSSYSISANGETFSTSPAVTSVISSTSNNSVSATVTDSRGQTSAAATESTTVLAYTMPSITSLNAERCDQSGNLTNTGAYMKVSYQVTVTALNNHNSKTLIIKYKKKTAQAYQSQSVVLSSYTASGNVIISADIDASYDVTAELTDDFGAASATVSLPTAFTMLNFQTGGGGIGIGKVCELTDRNAVEFSQDWYTYLGGPLVLVKNKHYFDSVSDLPVNAVEGQIAFVKV